MAASRLYESLEWDFVVVEIQTPEDSAPFENSKFRISFEYKNYIEHDRTI